VKIMSKDNNLRCNKCNNIQILLYRKEKSKVIGAFFCEVCKDVKEPFKFSVETLKNIINRLKVKIIEGSYTVGNETFYPEKAKYNKALNKALGKDLSKLSPKQRTEVKAEYHKIKQHKKIEGKTIQAKSLKNEGYAWYKIYKTLNLDRLQKEDQNRIKKAIEISE